MNEARRIARPLVLPLSPPEQPQIVARQEIVRGIEGTLPPVSGFVLTRLKQNPLVEQVIVSPKPTEQENATILATWTYGLGKAVAFTTDAGQRWTTAYNALGYKLQEIDGNGRTTRYQLGRFGQIQGVTVSGGDTAHRQGNSIHEENYTLDWQGRQVAVSDNYDKELYYTYDDADRLRRVQDVTTNKTSDYSREAKRCRRHAYNDPIVS